MTNLNNVINGLLLDEVEEVEKRILSGEFKKIDDDFYTIKIKIDGNVFETWNADDSSNTGVYRMKFNGSCIYYPANKFKKPASCRKILRENTNQKKIDAIDNKILKLNEEKKIYVANNYKF